MADPIAAAAVAPVNAPEVWTVNPLATNFNPGSKGGNQIFLEKSKGPIDGKRIGDTIADSQTLHSFLKTKGITFGPVVTHVPFQFDATGNPTNFASIIEQYQSLDLEHVQRQAHRRFGNALAHDAPIPNSGPTSLWTLREIDPATVDADKDIFYERVHATVVAQCLNNTLTSEALNNLDLKKHQFTFRDAIGNLMQDGPTMLMLLLLKADPSTSVSTENYRKANENAKLQKHGNNVSTLISFLETNHKHIIANGGSYEEETYRRHSLSALASGPNAAFNNFINDINQDVKSGTGYHAKITTKQLFLAAERFYNNEVSEERWDAVDPKDARIMALATEIEQLKQSQQKQPAAHVAEKPTSDSYLPEKWRMVKKGDTIVHNGVTHHWCPHHVHPNGAYSGLYYKDHDPSTHDEWKKKKKKGKFNVSDSKTAATTDATGKKKLTIANELKTAFATHLCLSEEDIDKIVAKTNGQEN
jgi:hypothetical protein